MTSSPTLPLAVPLKPGERTATNAWLRCTQLEEVQEVTIISEGETQHQVGYVPTDEMVEPPPAYVPA